MLVTDIINEKVEPFGFKCQHNYLLYSPVDGGVVGVGLINENDIGRNASFLKSDLSIDTNILWEVNSSAWQLGDDGLFAIDTSSQDWGAVYFGCFGKIPSAYDVNVVVEESGRFSRC